MIEHYIVECERREAARAELEFGDWAVQREIRRLKIAELQRQERVRLAREEERMWQRRAFQFVSRTPAHPGEVQAILEKSRRCRQVLVGKWLRFAEHCIRG